MKSVSLSALSVSQPVYQANSKSADQLRVSFLISQSVNQISNLLF